MGERVAEARPFRLLIATAFVASSGRGCANDKPGATPIERDTRAPSVVVQAPPGRGAACGPRGLPPDRHFVAEGLCARVVAHKQGPLRGLTFAPNGDLLAVTTDGSIRRYRDVDHDGVYGDGPPESIVWAKTGGDNGHNCEIDGRELYCGAKNGIKRWRYGPEIDQGGPGEDVVVGMPEGGRHPTHPVAVWDGWLYAVSGSADSPTPTTAADIDGHRSVMKRFPLERLAAGKPVPWSNGEIVVRGLRDVRGVSAMARDPRGHLIGIDDGLDDVARGGIDVHQESPGDAILALEPGMKPVERPISFIQAHSAALGMTFPRLDGTFALTERWRAGAFVALHGSWDHDLSTGNKVIWIPFDATGKSPLPTSTNNATSFPYETVFGGGKYGAPRDGEWSWKLGDAGEDPVRPVSVAISPVDGALYVSSDNAAGSTTGQSGSIYRIALLGQ